MEAFLRKMFLDFVIKNGIEEMLVERCVEEVRARQRQDECVRAKSGIEEMLVERCVEEVRARQRQDEYRDWVRACI